MRRYVWGKKGSAAAVVIGKFELTVAEYGVKGSAGRWLAETALIGRSV